MGQYGLFPSLPGLPIPPNPRNLTCTEGFSLLTLSVCGKLTYDVGSNFDLVALLPTPSHFDTVYVKEDGSETLFHSLLLRSAVAQEKDVAESVIMSPTYLLFLCFLMSFAQEFSSSIPESLWRPPSALLPPTDTYFYLSIDSPHCTSPTGQHLYTPFNASISAHQSTTNMINFDSDGDERWTGNFETGQEIAAKGFYDQVNKIPDGSNTEPAFIFSGVNRGRSCIATGGWFAIDEVGYEGGKLVSIEIRFGTESVKGALRWAATNKFKAAGPVDVPEDLWAPPAISASLKSNIAYIALSSGQTYTYTSPTDIISIESPVNNLMVQVIGDERWSGRFTSMRSLSRMEAGYYGDLVMEHHSNPVHGAMHWGKDANECTVGTGWYAIDSVEFSNDSQVRSVKLRFAYHCERDGLTVHGAVYWHKDNTINPSDPLLPLPSSLWSPPYSHLPNDQNYLYLESNSPEHLANSTSLLLPASTSLFTLTENDDQDLLISVEGDTYWQGTFHIKKRIEKVGFYGFYRHFIGYNSEYHGFKWTGMVISCTPLCAGWFVIDKIAYSDNKLCLLQLRFEIHYDYDHSPLYGALSWSINMPKTESFPLFPLPTDLWSPPNLPSNRNFLYIESNDTSLINGHETCYIVHQPVRTDLSCGIAFTVQCGGREWQGRVRGMRSLGELQAGYYGDIHGVELYASPVTGDIDFTSNGVVFYERRGWFAVRNVTYSDLGVLTSLDLVFDLSFYPHISFKGAFQWDAHINSEGYGKNCQEVETLWYPLTIYLPTNPVYLAVTENGLYTAYITGLNVTMSAFTVTVTVMDGSVTFHLAEVAPGCYDYVCWKGNCSDRGWVVISGIEVQGERVKALDMRFELREPVRVNGVTRWREGVSP